MDQKKEAKVEKSKLVTALREAGAVERCHTYPKIGRYTNAEHCYNMLCMAYVLYPGEHPPEKLIRAILYHDVPERWTGDIPAPVKSKIEGIQELESVIFTELGIGYQLDEETNRWLQALDKAELYVWARGEYALGNIAVVEILIVISRWLSENEGLIPDEVLLFLRKYTWERLGDGLP